MLITLTVEIEVACEIIVIEVNSYEAWQNYLFYVFVRFFALTLHKHNRS